MYRNLSLCFSNASYSEAAFNRVLLVTLLVLSMSITSAFNVYALQASPLGNGDAAAYDCTGVKLDEVDPENLTKAEQLALLDGVLIDSIDRYSSCVSQVQQEMAGGSGGNTDTGENAAGNDSSGNSEGVESTEMADSDTTEHANTPTSEGLPDEREEGLENTELPAQTSTSNNTNRELPQANTQDRKKLGVIPPKNNDAIICTILYDAIITEEDASIRSGLEQQYSDYQCGN